MLAPNNMKIHSYQPTGMPRNTNPGTTSFVTTLAAMPATVPISNVVQNK
jgi:hypothetical protein